MAGSRALAAPVACGEVRGSEVPRIWTPPLRELTAETSLGFECAEFAERVLGMRLLPWQRWWLVHALELRPDGDYRFKQVFLLVARQNGKTAVVKALILWKMFADDARLVLGGAQTLTDAEETWEDVVDLAFSVPVLARRLERPFRTSGKRRLSTLPEPDGSRAPCRYQVVTLKKDAGRGKTCDFLFLDELREHRSWDAWDALESTTLAPGRSQIVAASNAGDASSVVLRAKREAALSDIAAGETDGSPVGWFEYSAPEGCRMDDEAAIAQANPSYRHTLSPEALRAALSKPEASYRTENLCQEVRSLRPGVIHKPSWDACGDEGSEVAAGAAVFCALDVSWDRSRSAVAVAGRRGDGSTHVEVVAYRAGTDWLAPWLSRRAGGDWFTGTVALQARGAPASSLVEPLQESGLDVVEWGGTDLGRSFGNFYDAIRNKTVRHRGQRVLDLAVETAREKRLGDASFLDRRSTAADVCPLIAAQGAFWLAQRPVRALRRSIYEDDDVTAIFADQSGAGR